MNQYHVTINDVINFVIVSENRMTALILLKDKIGIDLEIMSQKNKIEVSDKGTALDDYGNKINRQSIIFENYIKLKNI